MSSDLKTDVIIVGAGPTGLALACQFIRYGIDFVIFDKREGITQFSKAIGVQARTLEIYEQIDLAQKLIEQGYITERVRLLEGGEVRGVLQLSELGRGVSPYPFLLIVEQSKHERLLYDFIKAHGKEVSWQRTLESFSQNESGVSARVIDSDGTHVIEARYLVACDGAKSSVRSALGLTFGGSTFERTFYVADVQIDWEFPHDSLIACLAHDSSTAFFPLPGENRYRIVGAFPEGFDKDEREILYDEIERQAIADTGLDLNIYNVNWFSSYRVHSRRVNKFSEGRCFLMGDSAHIHSPAGAQGMNTGIQDGYNLAWKLALVLSGKAHPRLLDTYNEERTEVAKRLLETTDRMFDFLASPSWFLAFFRTHVFPHVANFALGIERVNRFIFPLLSQVGINYRDRRLSVPDGKGFEVKAGDRMPYILVGGTSIYQNLRAPKFHHLTFSNDRSDHESPRTQIERQFGDLVDYNSYPLYPGAAQVFGISDAFSVLLRPDNYVGFVSSDTSVSALTAYLRDVVGCLENRAG